MPVKFDFGPFEKNLQQLQKYMQNTAPRITATEAIKHYQQSFYNQGFTDLNLVPWKPARRTQPQSTLYGFEAGARTRKPANHPSRRGKGKYKARKPNPITNYSPAATKRKTLSGRTGDLKESLTYTITPTHILIYSPLKYAAIHNQGGKATMFGRRTTTIPPRQFIGHSIKLNARIRNIITKDINQILK